MGRIDPDPSADDDQSATDRKNDFVHGLLAEVEDQAAKTKLPRSMSKVFQT